MTDNKKLYSVSELAEFSLPRKAPRFYEEKGLLSPKRAGTAAYSTIATAPGCCSS